MTIHALWRRLDTPGHDAARIVAAPGGGRTLEGTAVFQHEGEPACLHYRLELLASWATRAATVRGFLGARAVEIHITRDDRGWTFNGERRPGLEHLHDLDMGFTPATNLQHLRRVGLQPGQEADIPVVWLDDVATSIVELPQHYRCESPTRYRYDSPTTGYHETLELSPSGFVRDYPGLWVLE
jgi:uncharacterized protein